MGFFKVTAKCGHVGIGHYYRGLFYVRANNGKMASAIVRMMPRVKHDHKDAIIAVVKVDYAAYKEGKNISRTNPYFNSHSKQEQSQFSVKIKDDIHCETGFDDCKNYDNFDRRAKNEAILRCYRKMNKYNYNSIGA